MKMFILFVLSCFLGLSCNLKEKEDPIFDCNEVYNNESKTNNISICYYSENYKEINIEVNDTSDLDTISLILSIVTKTISQKNKSVSIRILPKKHRVQVQSILLDSAKNLFPKEEYDITINDIEGFDVLKK